MNGLKFLVFVLVPATAFSSELELWNLFSHDSKIWNCVSDLNEECVSSLGKKPVEQFLTSPELKLGEYVSIEKLKNRNVEQRDVEDIWDMEEVMNAGLQYVKNHALKVKFGDLEARMFQSPSKPESVELSVEARRRGAKAQRIYRVIIPLVIGFKITGLIIFGIVAVKLFLLKASMVANTALLVAGGVIMKKLYDHGMGLMTQHQSYLNSHHSLPNYYSHNQDFSGYGFGANAGYEGGAAAAAASSLQPEITDPVVPDDLHGGFSNHAIAIAALNKTLMQHQQQPKRRWSNKWAPWQNQT